MLVLDSPKSVFKPLRTMCSTIFGQITLDSIIPLIHNNNDDHSRTTSRCRTVLTTSGATP